MAADEQKAPKPITDEIATHSKDIDIFTGWVGRLENPDPTLRTEASGKGLKLYDEVDRDPHAGSVLQTRYLAVAGCDWDVVPAEPAAKKGRPASESFEQKVADKVKGILEATNFDQAMAEVLQAILYGYYPLEVLWRPGKELAISKLRAKHPRRFVFTPEREPRLLTPQNMIEGEGLPDRKFVIFTYGSSDNPYGKGLGQKLWWPVWFKKHGIKFWMVFLEKFGMPTAVGKYPPGTPAAQQQDLLDAIDAIHNETGLKIPDSMTIDLLEAHRQGKITYETLCEYMDKQISKAVLGQTLTTEVGAKGSYAASQTHDEVRQDIKEADAKALAETLNETLVRWIVDFNFPGVTSYPRFEYRTEQEKDLKPLAERDQILVNMGLPVTEQYCYDTYGIPVPEEGEEIVQAQGSGLRAQGMGPGDGPQAASQSNGMFAARGFSADQEQVERLIDATVARADAALKGLTSPVKDLVKGASSLEEIRAGLFALYPEMSKAELEGLAARAMFVADLYGRAAMLKKMDQQRKKVNR